MAVRVDVAWQDGVLIKYEVLDSLWASGFGWYECSDHTVFYIYAVVFQNVTGIAYWKYPASIDS